MTQQDEILAGGGRSTPVLSIGGFDASRRDVVLGAVAFAAATSGSASAQEPASIPKAPGTFDDVTKLGARIANLRKDGGYALGVETEHDILDIGATAMALGLPAPVDVDDLLQNGRGAELHAVGWDSGPW
jgi:hypothetical protein